MLSKRLRFEVLKRDNFRCTYCGAEPKQKQLHVDHVIPRALGGTDSPENLTTACEACNLGKASAPATDQMVAAVDVAIAANQAARAHASQALHMDSDSFADYEQQVGLVWDAYVPPSVRTDKWSLARIIEWFDSGVPVELIERALRLAVESDSVGWHAVAAYSSAVVRNKLQEALYAAYQDD